MRHHGIRTRIAGGSLLIALLVSIVAGLVINAQLERIVRDGTVAALRSDIAPYVFALQTRPQDALRGPGLATRIAVVAPDGSMPVFSLPTGLASRLPELASRGAGEAAGASGMVETAEVDGAEYVLVSTRVDVPGETWYVIAGRDVAGETTALVQMRLLLIGSFALLVVGVAAGAWLLTTASLDPVTRLRVSAQALSDSSTGELLPVGTADDEIAQLATTLNDLIERLRASAARERQIVSDASHELRTPLAILQTQLEIARKEASSVDQLLADIDGAERGVVRLSALVTSLLELSRIEGVGPSGRASVAELDLEAIGAVERARIRAGRADVTIGYTAPAGPETDSARFAVRAEDFGRVVDNLAGNSLRAMGASGALEVSLERDGDLVRLTVADTGGGLDPAFEPRALERFSRPDGARPAGEGAGLGLAIVAAIVKKAGGRIELRNRPGAGLTVVVTLRALPQAEPATP